MTGRRRGPVPKIGEKLNDFFKNSIKTMKFVLCRKCQDVFKLHYEARTCQCGHSKGVYLDDLYAEYSGDHAVPIGFDNHSLIRTLQEHPFNGERGKVFDAFIIPSNAETMVKVTDIKLRDT